MTIPFSIYRRRIDAVEGMFGDWKDDHKEAMKVMALEEVLSQFREVSSILIQGIEKLSNDFFRASDPSEDYGNRRTFVGFAEKLLSVFEEAAQEALLFSRKGYSVKNLSEMQGSLTDLKASVAAFKKTCPASNSSMLAKTATNIQQGEFKTAKGILHVAPTPK